MGVHAAEIGGYEAFGDYFGMGRGCVVCDKNLFDEGLEGLGVDVVYLLGLVGLVWHFGVECGLDVGFCCFTGWFGVVDCPVEVLL